MRKTEALLLAIAFAGLVHNSAGVGVRQAHALPQAEVTWRDILHESERDVYFDPLKQQRVAVKRDLRAKVPDAARRLELLARHGDVWANRLIAAGYPKR